MGYSTLFGIMALFAKELYQPFMVTLPPFSFDPQTGSLEPFIPGMLCNNDIRLIIVPFRKSCNDVLLKYNAAFLSCLLQLLAAICYKVGTIVRYNQLHFFFSKNSGFQDSVQTTLYQPIPTTDATISNEVIMMFSLGVALVVALICALSTGLYLWQRKNSSSSGQATAHGPSPTSSQRTTPRSPHGQGRKADSSYYPSR